MAKLRQPRLFSQHFNIDPAHLAREQTFDPILNFDTRLFIDPTLLDGRRLVLMRSAWQRYLRWFRVLGQDLARSQCLGDSDWNTALKRLHFPEPPSTCLGYTAEGVKGKGIGNQLAERLLRAAYGLVRSGSDDAKWVRALPFLYKGMGPDRISDMATQLILPNLAAHTCDVLKGFNIPTVRERIDSENYDLPAYNGRPVLLVPLDVLSEIPAASDIGELSNAITHNSDLRSRVSAHLDGMIRVGALGWINELIELVVKGKKEAVDAFSELLEGARIAYDTEADPNGHITWRRYLSIATRFPVKMGNSVSPDEKIGMIVQQFETLLHEPDISRGLYRDINAEEPRPVDALRFLFFAIAHSYCMEQGDLTVEYDTDSGLSSFMLNNRILLSVDVASSAQSNLRARYEGGQHDGRLFVLIDFADEAKVIEVLASRNAIKSKGSAASEIKVIEV